MKKQKAWEQAILLCLGMWLVVFCFPGARLTTNQIPVSAPYAQSDQKVTEPLEDLSLYAQSAVLLDADTGRILYAKNADTVRPMASTTKIMTCILALEEGDLDEKVVASKKAASQPKVHLGVREGQEFFLKDLLYSLMLESHNDSAVMIAEHLSGSCEAFAARMNEKARAIGCEDTWFITPNGLDAKERDATGIERTHSTTAGDLAKIMAYCVSISPKRDEFLQITQAGNHFFFDCAGKNSYSCVNHNALLTMMDGVLSGKTGFTGGAGYSYVAALESEGRTFTLALLGCGWPPHKAWKWADARALFSYGKKHFQKKDVYEEQTLPKLALENGIYWDGAPQEIALVAEEKRPVETLLSEGENVRIEQHLPKTIQAPVTKGQKVGEIVYYLDEVKLAAFEVYAAQDAQKLTLRASLCYILEKFLTKA